MSDHDERGRRIPDRYALVRKPGRFGCSVCSRTFQSFEAEIGRAHV